MEQLFDTTPQRIVGYGPAPALATARGAAPPGPSLTQQTTRGFAWMLTQTLGSKLAGIVAQVLLARLLLKSDFGLAALAGTAAGFAGVIQQLGLKQVLVQRQSRMRLFANAAFWMGLASGIAASIALIIAAPIAAAVYHDRRIMGLVLVLALSPPLDAAALVPTAYQNVHLRFKLLAANGLFGNVSLAGLQIMFALLGFGAYSFVLPRPIVSAGQAAFLWYHTPQKPHWFLQLRRWRYLLADTAFLLTTTLAYTFVSQGDYMSLGFFHSKEQVGVFYFAFNLSTQPAQLLVVNLVNVLFPVLSRLKLEPRRQAAAFVRTERTLRALGVSPVRIASPAGGTSDAHFIWRQMERRHPDFHDAELRDGLRHDQRRGAEPSSGPGKIPDLVLVAMLPVARLHAGGSFHELLGNAGNSRGIGSGFLFPGRFGNGRCFGGRTRRFAEADRRNFSGANAGVVRGWRQRGRCSAISAHLSSWGQIFFLRALSAALYAAFLRCLLPADWKSLAEQFRHLTGASASSKPLEL